MNAQQLAARLIAEGLVGLPELAQLIPARRGSGRMRSKTLAGWARQGRLEAVQADGRWLSSRAALARALVSDGIGAAPAADDRAKGDDDQGEAKRAERVAQGRRLMEMA